MLGLPETVHACLFDLDGVLTDTASVHTKAWKVMFDDYLSQRSKRTGEPFVPFDPVDDYQRYVDGKKREDGVRSFLSSRGIEIPDGDPDDPPEAETVYGLGNRKNDAFQKTLHDDGVTVFEGSRRYLRPSRTPGCGHRCGLVQRQHPRRSADHRPRAVRPATGRRRDPARRAHRGQAGSRLLPAGR